MAETQTPNYGWPQPDVGGDASVWGNTLNNSLALIDAQVWTNEQATIPVGSGAFWFGAAAPANWLLCQGQSLSTTTYAALFAVLGYTYGGSGASFNLPNLQVAFPIGSGTGMALGAIGGASSTVLSAAQLPAHTHTITQVAHSHTATQPAHIHPDPGHTHSATAVQNAHNHGLNGDVVLTTGTGLTPGGQAFSIGAGATDTQQPAISVSVVGNGTGLQAAGADAITVTPTTPPGPTATGSVGSGSPVPTIPPFVSVNFMVRYQ